MEKVQKTLVALFECSKKNYFLISMQPKKEKKMVEAFLKVYVNWDIKKNF